jgi:hypothetical protein
MMTFIFYAVVLSTALLGYKIGLIALIAVSKTTFSTTPPPMQPFLSYILYKRGVKLFQTLQLFEDFYKQVLDLFMYSVLVRVQLSCEQHNSI